MKRIFFALLIALLTLPAAGVLPVQAGDCDTDLYVVKKGETLTSIATKCKIEPIVLMNINYEISNPDLIRPGQKLRLTAEVPIPDYMNHTGPAQVGGLQPGGVYLVRKGDSLALIAYLYNTTVPELLSANPQLGGRFVIYPGQQIRLPQVAQQKKGWVGVSTLVAAYTDAVEARALDFPPYTRILFRLHYLPPEEAAGDNTDTDSYSITVTVQSDARGEARATLIVPYWSYTGEYWVIDAVDLDSPQAVKATSPKILICDVEYDSSIGDYKYICPQNNP